MTARTIAWRPSPATGRLPGSENSRPAGAALSCRWLSGPARRFSSTGRKTGPSSAASEPNCRSPTFKLSYSRAFILRAYPQQTHEMLFDAHNHAFRVLGGVPRRGIYDNLWTSPAQGDLLAPAAGM